MLLRVSRACARSSGNKIQYDQRMYIYIYIYRVIMEIKSYRNITNLLNKRNELISKCRHENKFYIKNYKREVT